MSPEHVEELCRALADPKCKRCWGTGRSGFRGGIPMACRCAKRELDTLRPFQPQLDGKTEEKADDYVRRLRALRDTPKTTEVTT